MVKNPCGLRPKVDKAEDSREGTGGGSEMEGLWGEARCSKGDQDVLSGTLKLPNHARHILA